MDVLGKLFQRKTESKLASKSQMGEILNQMSQNIINRYNPNILEFQQIFVYGKKMNILHKGSIKGMFVYLDHQRDKLLWISSTTKAFLIDLYFTTSYLKEESDMKKLINTGKKLFYFSLRQLDDQIIFIFDNQKERDDYMNLFKTYTDELKKIDPNYLLYFSNIAKMLSLHSTQNGNNQHTKSQILKISQNVGLKEKKHNEQALQACFNQYRITNEKQIHLQCVDYYFAVRFCNNIDLQNLYERYSGKISLGNVNKEPRKIFQKNMTPQNFTLFLKECQKQKKLKIQKILQKYKGSLSFFDFCKYIYDSSINHASQAEELNLSYPLHNYFCYSSHNTYLDGNQLSSNSKAERYEQDLYNGVKCVELDVHNDGVKPIVTHAFKGKGLCTPVDFEDVIKVISNWTKRYKREARQSKNDHLPLILSIENHASAQNREEMLDIMAKYFGKNIYFLSGNQTQFPTLQALSGKILIKSSSNEKQVLNFKKKTLAKKVSSLSASFDFTKKLENPAERFQNTKLKEKYQKFLDFQKQFEVRKQQFNRRIIKFEQIFIPISSMAKVTSIFKSAEGIKNPKPSNFVCTSLTHTKVISLDYDQLVKYTCNSWLRTYPIGTEIASNNYTPAPMLKVGAQIIALNTQTKDEYAWMAYAYFCGGNSASESRRGYVLKPQKLRNSQISEQKKNPFFLTIKILQSSGYDVKMKFQGLESDNVFNSEAVDKFTYYNPNESFILFDFGGKYRDCVALRFISEGYRIIEGRNANNYLDCGIRVLIHVSLTIAQN